MSERRALQALVRGELALSSPNRRRARVSRRAFPALAFVAWCLGSSGLTAQVAPYRQELIPGLSSIQTRSNARPTLLDIDGDGDLDVVSSGRAGKMTVFENTGSSNVPAFVERIGSGDPFGGGAPIVAASPALADLDGDDDLDMVAGSFQGPPRMFENTGSSAFPSFVEQTGGANPFAVVGSPFRSFTTLVDLDDDDDLDAVVGRVDGDLLLLENTGGTSTPTFEVRLGTDNPFDGFDVGENATPELVDLDGDEDLDLVAGERTGGLFAFENTGSPMVPVFVEQTGATNPFVGIDVGFESEPALGDLDGDGDFDLVTGDAFGSLRLFENTGSSGDPTFVEEVVAASPFGGTSVGENSKMVLVDLDGDGDLDVVAGARSGELFTFENTGTSHAPAFAEQVGSDNPFDGLDVGFYSDPALADLDSDGDLDAIVGERYGALLLFENTGDSNAPAFVEQGGTDNPLLGVDVGNLASPALVDLDDDGDADAVIGDSYGILRYFENTGGARMPIFVEQTGAANPFDNVNNSAANSYLVPAFADVDGDGDFDVIQGNLGGAFRFYRNTGSPTAPAFRQRTGSANPFDETFVEGFAAPSLGDLDGDGDLDLLSGDAQGRVIFFRLLNRIFSDSFERGDTSGWSGTVPQ